MEIYKNLSLEDLENEIWKDIPNYEGIYQASNMGRVKALSRYKECESRNMISLLKEKILKQSLTKGYFRVKLYKNGKGKTTLTHSVIASCFLNHTTNGRKLNVDHINNISTDNRLKNLQVITSRENNTKDKINKSGYSGVKKISTNSFQAYLVFKAKQINLGSFKTAELASKARQKAIELIESGVDISYLGKTQRKSSTGIIGVYANKGKFQASLRRNGKLFFLGTFETIKEASDCYKKAKSEI